eukprot:SAG11_NODE_2501_length_3281_cov_1.563168_4_plen_116_part_00
MPKVRVRVPKGVTTGGTLQIETERGTFQVIVPPGVKEGDTIRVVVPERRQSAPPPQDNGKKVRRPYTIKKKRETWTEEEHKKFLEALHFYHRDWKKISQHVGTRTVFQARSHAQK